MLTWFKIKTTSTTPNKKCRRVNKVDVCEIKVDFGKALLFNIKIGHLFQRFCHVNVVSPHQMIISSPLFFFLLRRATPSLLFSFLNCLADWLMFVLGSLSSLFDVLKHKSRWEFVLCACENKPRAKAEIPRLLFCPACSRLPPAGCLRNRWRALTSGHGYKEMT